VRPNTWGGGRCHEQRLFTIWTVLHAWLAATLIAAPSLPCDPTTSMIWKRLGSPIKLGQRVLLETVGTQKVTGTVSQIGSESVILDQRGDLRRVPLDVIKVVRSYHDDTTTGMVIGGSFGSLGGGLFGIVVGALISLGNRSNPGATMATSGGLGLLTGGGIGTMIGWAGGTAHSGYRKVYDYDVASVTFMSFGGCDAAEHSSGAGQDLGNRAPVLFCGVTLPSRSPSVSDACNLACKTNETSRIETDHETPSAKVRLESPTLFHPHPGPADRAPIQLGRFDLQGGNTTAFAAPPTLSWITN
jgi:hypothetical protein